MTSGLAGYRHIFRPGSERTLLLLHGTGGSESDLLPMAEALDPAAAILSPRGKVLENGMARFFRRFAEGVLDFADVAARAGEPARFVDASWREYDLDPRHVIAAAYSNGAKAGAALFRAMVPVPESHARTRRPTPLAVPVPVLIANGLRDSITPPQQGERLAGLPRADGAAVTMHWHPGGHPVSPGDVEADCAWLAAVR